MSHDILLVLYFLACFLKSLCWCLNILNFWNKSKKEKRKTGPQAEWQQRQTHCECEKGNLEQNEENKSRDRDTHLEVFWVKEEGNFSSEIGRDRHLLQYKLLSGILILDNYLNATLFGWLLVVVIISICFQAPELKLNKTLSVEIFAVHKFEHVL